MAGRGVDVLGMARRRAVAPAVVRRTEVRAALEHLARDAGARLARIVAALGPGAARVRGDAAGLGRVGLVLGRVPVGRPFPDVADHVVDAVAVGRERAHRRRPRPAVGAQVLVRKVALPGVGHMPAVRRELVAPGEVRAVQSAARGEFPFRFGRQFLAGPLGVGLGVLERHLHDGMIVQSADMAAFAVGPPPRGAEGEAPPLAEVAEVDGLAGRREHQPTCLEHLRQGAGIILGIGRDLRPGHIVGRRHEGAELRIGDRRGIDPESVDRDAVARRFVGIMPVRAHAEGAAGNADHVGHRRARRDGRGGLDGHAS